MAESAPLALANLTVERKTDPIGLDSPRPRFSWRLIGAGATARQSAFQLQVQRHADAADWSAPLWDSGRRETGDSVYVSYDGPPLLSRGRYQWRMRVWDAAAAESGWSEDGTFEMGLLSAEDWSARWIAHLVPDAVSEPEERNALHPAPLLRRRFSLAAVPRSARLYITALGVYEAYLNGARVGSERLAPGWTDFHTRIQYQTFDVTSLLQRGTNVLAVMLGDGWYRGSLGGWGGRRYGDRPSLLCQLEAHDSNGERVVVPSDQEWVARSSGTWMHDLQHGERTDLRNDSPGWSGATLDDADWTPVSMCADPGALLVASRDDGIRVVQTLPAVAVHAIRTDRSIVDMGVNGAGVLRLTFDGTAGQQVVIRHAEALDASGELYVENLRGAQQQDEFTLSTDGAVTLEPRFTFHGFRYAEISGLREPFPASGVEYQLLSSANGIVGEFSCSDPVVDQLQHNILTSLRANFISVPTDCPQRNERLGWTADLQIFAPTALFNADVTTMIDKWLQDLVDAQLPSGAYTDIAPAPSGWSGGGNTAWGDAGIITPWVLYQRSGDSGVLERMYGSMRRYLRFLESDQTRGLRFGGRYGDWVSLGARTDKVFIGTAYLAHVAELFSLIAAELGNSDDEQHYAAFAERVRQALQDRFLQADGRLQVETQTAYAMALGFHLLPEADRQAAGDRLAELVEATGTHLATGFLGTPLVLPALSDNGHHELACRLLRQDTYPSWLFEVRNGATSIWERWNGWTPDQGFYSPRMNSFNHYAFGAVGDWMYRYLAGLDPVEPGYRRTVIRPRPGGGFTSARAVHESLYGVHTSGWRIEGDVLHVQATVPANTSATVVLPVDDVEGVRLNGAVPTSYTRAEGAIRIDLPPGDYHMEAPSHRS